MSPIKIPRSQMALLLWLGLFMSLSVSFSAAAQAKIEYKSPEFNKSFEQAQKERADAISKIGIKKNDGSVCQKCPAACEQVCASSDAKCIAEIDKRREPHLAQCRKNGQL